MAKRCSKYSGKKKKKKKGFCVASWARWDAQWKSLMELGKKVSGHESGNTTAEQKQAKFRNAIEGNLRVQSRASERLPDQIIEEIKAKE